MGEVILNEKIYNKESIVSKEYVLNDAVINLLFMVGKWEEIGHFVNQEVELESTVSVDMKRIEALFGAITEDDLENIYYFLSEHGTIKQRMKQRLDQIKPVEVHTFNLDLFVAVNKHQISIHASVDKK